MERLKQQLQAEGIAYRADEPLAAHCTFKIGGPADVFALPETEEQLCRVIALCKEQGVKYYLLGNGSNILFEDAGYRGVVIDTMALKMGIGFLEQVAHPGAAPGEVYDAVVAGAGLKLSSLCTAALENSLTGLEFAYGIPGTVGGAVYMNAGAYGGEMCQVVTEVTALLPEGVRRFTAEEAAFGYRRSAFLDTEAVVLGARLRLTPDDPAAIRRRMDDLMARRRQSQPLEYPSAGSTFKRPEGYFAGTLIEQTGLKGLTVGGAQVSTKHAGFVINVGGATSADVEELIRQVQQAVYAAHGVHLEPEVRIVR